MQVLQIVPKIYYLMSLFTGDIWLSLLYRPPVTLSDTACTLSANLSMNVKLTTTFLIVLLLNSLERTRENQKALVSGEVGRIRGSITWEGP